VAPPQSGAASADEVLATTRAVRRRLDLGRPVERELLRECLRLAQQAPSGGNGQPWHFVFVTDPSKRSLIASIYREVAEQVLPRPETIDEPDRRRVYGSAWFLVEHLSEVPVLMIPCVTWPRDEGAGGVGPGMWASVLQATWSFMLAARARGLGTAWTSIHLQREREVADLLGIPYEQVRQAALIPVAYAHESAFRPASRPAIEEIEHWEHW
jgi:nitroreductase